MRTGQGFLAVWSDIPPPDETDYLHWLMREHVEERLSLPGFLAVRVFRSRAGDVRRYFILYTLTDAGVLASQPYLDRLNAPTPWSQRIMPMLGNFRRGGGTIVARRGFGAGGVVAPILIQRPDEAAAARLGEIAGCDRIVAASLLTVDGAGTGIGTAEKTLRAGDQSFDTMLLVEAPDAASLTAAVGAGHEAFDQIFALDQAMRAS